MTLTTVPWIVLYAATMIGIALGMLHWRISRRPTRHPLGQDVTLRRQPGEHLRQELEKALSDDLLGWIFTLILLPMVGLLAPFAVVKFVPHASAGFLILSGLAAGGAALAWTLQRGYRLMERIQNLRLGWFGERSVADQLEVLKSKGYEVFHDVPCIGANGPFNLDHVVVGQGRVIVIETKTRRKPKGMPDGHKVSYDGERLTWPWGPSTDELDQALNGVKWLRKELKKQLNLDVNVRAALTIPGWYVTGGPPQAPVLVESYTRLPRYLMGRFQAELTAEQTDLVARQLRQLSGGLDYAGL